MSDVRRIAMWSGPRNISTALLRAFENRPDTVVCDEPLYAFYLRVTGLAHPGRDAVLASQSDDWRDVVAALSGPVAGEATVFYQKHMAHHLCGDIEIGWVEALDNAFLIRDPHAMLVSLARVLPRVTLDDTGLPQQLRLFEHLCARGAAPPVIDSRDVLGDPAGLLAALCARVGIAFDDAMLSWPAGPRASDGVWAPYWYDSVIASTGFGRWQPCHDPLPDEVAPLYDDCRQIYDTLSRHRLGAAP